MTASKGGALNAGSLMAEAQALTGLEDFGQPQFIAGLEALVASIEAEAALTEAGLTAQRQRLQGLLVNRLRIEQALREHPQVRDELPGSSP